MKFNKFKKISEIVMVIVLSTVLSACASEAGNVLYNENGVEVYFQQDQGQKLYKNNNEGFKMACRSEWDVQIGSDDGYLTKFVLDTGNGNAWLGIKKEPLEVENQDISAISEKYSNLLKNGIVKSTNVTIGGKKGKWIKVEPIEGSGIGMKNSKGEKVEIDTSNLVTNDEDEEREDLIFISDGKFVYLFLFHADNVSIYNSYENDIDSFLGTFQFI